MLYSLPTSHRNWSLRVADNVNIFLPGTSTGTTLFPSNEVRQRIFGVWLLSILPAPEIPHVLEVLIDACEATIHNADLKQVALPHRRVTAVATTPKQRPRLVLDE